MLQTQLGSQLWDYRWWYCMCNSVQVWWGITLQSPESKIADGNVWERWATDNTVWALILTEELTFITKQRVLSVRQNTRDDRLPNTKAIHTNRSFLYICSKNEVLILFDSTYTSRKKQNGQAESWKHQMRLHEIHTTIVQSGKLDDPGHLRSAITPRTSNAIGPLVQITSRQTFTEVGDT